MARRLAAILNADVVGYSLLMGADDAGTLAALRTIRDSLFHPNVDRHHGRIVKLMGDGLLVEFSSIVEAVECAIKIQSELREFNKDRSENQRLTFRMGVGLGDVITEGDDMYGDGLNIASRLEALAEPGGICISGDAFRHVRGKLRADFQDLGNHSLKNIDEPVQVFHWKQDVQEISIASGDKSLNEIGVPIVAVLPIEPLSRDQDCSDFARGLTDEIITAFSRQTGMNVLAQHSTASPNSKNLSPIESLRNQGASYVLQGSVRLAGGRIRVAAQFLDLTSGKHLWGEQFDGDMSDVFSLQDQVTLSIAAATRSQIHVKDAQRVRNVPEDELTDDELLSLASEKMQSLEYRSTPEAARLLSRILDRNQNHPMALAMAASCFLLQNDYECCDVSETDKVRAFELIDRSILINEQSDYAHYVRGRLFLFFRQELDHAQVEAERSLELNPNYTYAYALLGFVNICNDQPEKGIDLIEKALHADPRRSRNADFFVHLANGHFVLGDYNQALNWLDKAIQRIGAVPYLRVLSAVFNILVQNPAKARSEIRTILQLVPNLTVRMVKKPPMRNPGILNRYVRSLLEAGLPE